MTAISPVAVVGSGVAGTAAAILLAEGGVEMKGLSQSYGGPWNEIRESLGAAALWEAALRGRRVVA